MGLDNRTREIRVIVPEEVYAILEDLARKEGYSNILDYITSVLVNLARTRRVLLSDEVADRLRVKLERYVQDELNKRMNVVEALKRQIVEIYEKIESIEQKISSLEDSLRGVETEKAKVRAETAPRRTAIERLKEEKVVFESKLPPRIQRDRLFAYFERTGAVVLKLARERVAVDQDFWQEFKRKLLNEIYSNREEDLMALLGEKGYELWKALYNDNLLIFDSKTRKWRFVQSGTP